MNALDRRTLAAMLFLVAVAAAPLPAQVQNLRVTEVSPTTDEAEVTNTGPAFTTGSLHPFCYSLDYSAAVPSATMFSAGGALVFPTLGLNDTDSDQWLYLGAPFEDGGNIIHGVKYGPLPSVGRVPEAVGVGLWPSLSAFTPAPPMGTTLAWDGFGFNPHDWYVDETPTLGSADSSPVGTVPTNLAFPLGTDDYENMSLGDSVTAMATYVIVAGGVTPGTFDIRAINDLNGVVGPRPGSSSTQWLRIRDQDAVSPANNRFYTGAIVTPNVYDYRWTFYINTLETPPGAGAAKPRFTIQHRDGAAFQNAWGIEFADTGASLVVTGIGGLADSEPLYPLSSPTGLGDWVKLTLTVDFGANTVSAAANDGAPVSLPTNLSLTANKSEYRFCYRGEGTGNINTMLVDDVTIEVVGFIPTVSQWGVVAMTLLLLTGGTIVYRKRLAVPA